MSTGLIEIMKRAALDATDNAQMCDLRYGKVISVSPLKVQITNQFTIPASLLVVPKHLTNFTVDVTVNWDTDSSGSHSHSYSGNTDKTSGGSEEASFASHSHSYGGTTESEGEHSHGISGKKTMTIHNALKIGDKVALLRKQGGQSYFILDRI